MRPIEVFIAFTFLGITTAHARLNDSMLDFTQRFGQPQSVKKEQHFGSQELIFHQDGWVIRAWLRNGHCHMISYLRTGVARPTEAQIAGLLDSNSEGEKWSEARGGFSISRLLTGGTSPLGMSRSDQQAFGQRLSHGIVLKTATWLRLEEAESAWKTALREVVPRF